MEKVKGQGETEDGNSKRASSLDSCCQCIAYFIAIVFVSLSINTDMLLSILKSHCLNMLKSNGFGESFASGNLVQVFY